MHYQFSLTPRLLALGTFAVVALLALVFAIGFMLGLRIGEPDLDAAASAPPASARAPTP